MFIFCCCRICCRSIWFRYIRESRGSPIIDTFLKQTHLQSSAFFVFTISNNYIIIYNIHIYIYITTIHVLLYNKVKRNNLNECI